jgi:hypothetical protein
LKPPLGLNGVEHFIEKGSTAEPFSKRIKQIILSPFHAIPINVASSVPKPEHEFVND